MTLPTRTLKDYARHDADCDTHKHCQRCEWTKNSIIHHGIGAHAHDLIPTICSCGLDHLLAEFDAPGAQERKEDFSAGLIGPTIPDVVDTEPRLNSLDKLKSANNRARDAIK